MTKAEYVVADAKFANFTKYVIFAADQSKTWTSGHKFWSLDRETRVFRNSVTPQ